VIIGAKYSRGISPRSGLFGHWQYIYIYIFVCVYGKGKLHTAFFPWIVRARARSLFKYNQTKSNNRIYIIRIYIYSPRVTKDTGENAVFSNSHFLYVSRVAEHCAHVVQMLYVFLFTYSFSCRPKLFGPRRARLV